jgi:hypothetical protein
MEVCLTISWNLDICERKREGNILNRRGAVGKEASVIALKGLFSDSGNLKCISKLKCAFALCSGPQ